MTIFFLEHLPGCTPLVPCASCRAHQYLKDKLGDVEFSSFISYVREQTSDQSAALGHPLPRLSFDKPIAALDLPSRAASALLHENLRTIADIVQQTESELMRIPDFGKKSLRDLVDALEAHGHELGEMVPDEFKR